MRRRHGADRGQCLDDLAQLYASWEVAEPGEGHDAKAADWKARVDAEKE